MNTPTDLQSKLAYCSSLTSYSRRKTKVVYIGELPVGDENPIRIQSMTTVDTMDTKGSVDQAIRMIEAGCEYVRITAPSLNEAKNLAEIKRELRNRGFQVPLIADIHFTPNAAETAARIVEKVRINPGNYADRKKFQIIEYDDESYQKEIDRIRERFTPLVKICKEYGTAMRIGTNHGSLSDRIMSRYGDTPLGMVESALEFLRICEDLGYYDIVLSMKASNTLVMVQAYRMLINRLEEESLQAYPLHLGVTEAGEGEDGRIKSAVGIGALLEDGLGDTVRVSLTEEPEFEAPVAKELVKRYETRSPHTFIQPIQEQPTNPFAYSRRSTAEVGSIGDLNVPRVIVDASNFSIEEYADLEDLGHYYVAELDKWKMNDLGSDYIYSGKVAVPFMLPNGLREILDYETWELDPEKATKYPLFTREAWIVNTERHQELNFLYLSASDLSSGVIRILDESTRVVLILGTDNLHGLAEQRRFFFELVHKEIELPVILHRHYANLKSDQLQLYSATDVGGLLIDGYGDGVMITCDHLESHDPHEAIRPLKLLNDLSFGILQAARTRMTKTEYISCPSCGRTLFDLQATTAKIRKLTDHLKGVKIGIMGCIVNGPGEMADADYGYVGSGKGKITLYKGQEVVKKAVPSKDAVDELIEIIKNDGNWIDPIAIAAN